MARKSRKHLLLKHEGKSPQKPENAPPPVTLVAGYIRLSVRDKDKAGNSIETQMSIIQQYINDDPKLKLYDLYIDDGKSGMRFERPDFRRMIEDIEHNRHR